MFFFARSKSLETPSKSKTMTSEFIIRNLESNDLNEYVKLLGQLTLVQEHVQADLEERLQLISKNPFHRIFVLTDQFGKLLGCATLLIEPKFIRGMVYLAHIEDVCVNREFRGHGLGQILIEHLSDVARQSGCYKVSLNCSEKNVKFYQNCGFTKHECQMVQTLVRSKL